MKATEFCYWLQGFFELNQAAEEYTNSLTSEQSEIIQRYLALVFSHDIDPQAGPQKHQTMLNSIHGGNGMYRC
jgi:hypothetical protein